MRLGALQRTVVDDRCFQISLDIGMNSTEMDAASREHSWLEPGAQQLQSIEPIVRVRAPRSVVRRPDAPQVSEIRVGFIRPTARFSDEQVLDANRQRANALSRRVMHRVGDRRGGAHASDFAHALRAHRVEG